MTKHGKVVLVTSRGSGEWIFPKGCREKGRSDRSVAKEEAYEEAGVFGDLNHRYVEFKVPCRCSGRLRIFRMKVSDITSKFPESRERRRVIVPISRAEKMLSKDLRAILKKMI